MKRTFWSGRLCALVTGAIISSLAGAEASAIEATCGIAQACDENVCDFDCYGSDLPRCWVRADYLYWQLDGSDVPALITSSPVGTPLAQAGRLGDPSTSLLAGNDTLSDGGRSGFALSAGCLIDPCEGLSIIGDYFNAGRDSFGISTVPSATQIIARPFLNAQTGTPDAEFVNVPNELAGSVRVAAFEDFQGGGFALQKSLLNCGDPCSNRLSQLSMIGGYRFYQHDSSLAFREDLLVLPGTSTPLIPGTVIDVTDRFGAKNEFHGGELGLQGRVRYSELWVEGLALLAVGGNRRTVHVDGSTVSTVPNVGSATNAGGLLTSEATNIGRYSDSQAVVIPRFRFGVGAQLTEFVAARAGYNVIIWGDVAQAAAHLPPGLAVDPRNIPPVQAGGGADPAFPGIQGSTVVAHGLDIGLEVAY